MRVALIAILVVTGVASQYAPGVMDEVISTRQRMGQLPQDIPEVDGFVARPLCSEIGEIVYLRPVGQSEWEKFLVVDCGCPVGYAWMVNNGVLVEVDYETAARWGTVGYGIDIEMLTEREWEFMSAGPRQEVR